MTKCMYLESDVTKSGAPIIVTCLSRDMKWEGLEQKKFAHTFSASYRSIIMMMDEAFNPGKDGDMTPDNRPKLGDVIWLRTGGGRVVGFGIVKERHDDPIHTKALKAVFKNYNKKAKDMKIPMIGMDVYGCESGKDWASVVGIIEDKLTDCQAVVCVPTNEKLIDVLDELPGETKSMLLKAENSGE